jgi:hypothetical protein
MDTAKNTPSWMHEATGLIDVKAFIDGHDGINPLARRLKHVALLLANDLDDGFDTRRGSVNGTNVTLTFQADGIEATLWLLGEAYNAAQDLAALIDTAQAAIDEAAE